MRQLMIPSPSWPGRRQRYSARAFYLTLLAISCLVLYSALASRHGNVNTFAEPSALFARSEDADAPKENLECRAVHSFPDKCAFVQNNCPDEQAGLIPYLEFYYCKLPNAKPFAFIVLALWLAMLFSTIGIAASDFLCINLSTISSILGMSESLAGVTFLAFGNGSPDVFSTFAAMSTNSGSLAIGELVGAAGFITAVVAGSMAIVRPFKVARRSFVRDVGFFVVAASFSMVFLADGHLYAWECIAMIVFYVFYVITVVVWHWYITRRRSRLDREAAARSHFHIPENQELDMQTPEPDEERRNLLNAAEDFSALERANQPAWMDEEEEDDQARDRYMAELSSNMRVRRRTIFERRPTLKPIRPSLVGALEFRSVLSSLQRSRSSQTIPINPIRRYSDAPTPIFEDPSSPFATRDRDSYFTMGTNGVEITAPRPRAKSVHFGGGAATTANPRWQGGSVPQPGLTLPPSRSQASSAANARDQIPSLLSPAIVDSPMSGLSPSTHPIDSNIEARSPMTAASGSPKSFRLKPPVPKNAQNRNMSPNAAPPLQTAGIVSGHNSVSSTPLSPFPSYRDEPLSAGSSRPPSLYLPEPSIPAAEHSGANVDGTSGSKPLQWWPYEMLPAPRVIASTLFPTLFTWEDKSIWDKFLAIIATPSVFLLTITLPVVEPEDDENIPDVDPGLLSPHPAPAHEGSASTTPVIVLAPESFAGNGQAVNAAASPSSSSLPTPSNHKKSPDSTHLTVPGLTAAKQPEPHSPDTASNTSSSGPSPRDWNRWLTIVQVVMGPLFVTLIVLANSASETTHIGPLTIMIGLLSCFAFSALLTTILLFTSTASEPPSYRFLFCFIGFIVAIFWISTIANEVVGVLKTIGVILNISDSILGLTIFAVGNSLGDLVADITVAKLGFPVMALSACFGGPMLNILLGIGVSGLYMTLQQPHDPSAPPGTEPSYRIHVGRTLLVSGIALLVTLAGLLIMVPVNGWRMDRRIGYGLVALWIVSTAANVGIEIAGWGGDVA